MKEQFITEEEFSRSIRSEAERFSSDMFFKMHIKKGVAYDIDYLRNLAHNDPKQFKNLYMNQWIEPEK